MYKSSFLSSFGFIRARSSDAGLYALDWQQQPFLEDEHENDVSRETIQQIKLYLNSQLTQFVLPLELSHHSPAFVKWLSVLNKVPFGQVITYKAFAEKWGNIKAARAAGQACQRNPLPIVIPCHSIVQADGKLGKYSGGDRVNPGADDNIQRKRWLINLEAKSIS